jgi:PRELI-like family
MVFDTLNHIFKYPWRDISHASWRKYPNATRPDVLSVDIIDRHFDPETGIFTATRLLTTDPKFPSWMSPFCSNVHMYCLEETVVDPRNQTMVLRSKNITGSSLLELEEVCKYVPSPSGESTLFEQNVSINAHLFGLASRIEDWTLDNFQRNALRGRDIMEEAVLRVRREAEEIVEEIVDKVPELVTELVPTPNFQV